MKKSCLALCLLLPLSASAGWFSWGFGSNSDTKKEKGKTVTTNVNRTAVRQTQPQNQTQTQTPAQAVPKATPVLTAQTQVPQVQSQQPYPSYIHYQAPNHATHAHDSHDGHSHEIERQVGTEADYQAWLNERSENRQRATEYQRFLNYYLGANSVPPMRELLTTARSWQECGYDPYQVPPKELWGQMLPTIRLYNELRQRGILPATTKIRSVYRNPELNRCAGGALSSKHMTNGAMDIWVPEYEVGSWQLYNVQNKLCQFWITNGERHRFGLGIYATGAIHLDTQGYRKWGGQFSQIGSPCRYTPPKPEVLYIDGQGWAE